MPPEHPASDISVAPAGEITATDAQAALEDLDHRTRIDRFLDDREVGFNVKEDFLGGGNYPAGGWIGQNGWNIPVGITATAPPNIQVATGAFGVVAIGTLNSAQWNNINLGTNLLTGAPLLHLKLRARLPNLNAGAHRSSYFVGLHSDQAGVEPQTGMYFRYTQTDGAAWVAVVANGGSRSSASTGVAPVAGAFQWFEIISDGAGVIRFYIDGALVQVHDTNLPSGSNRYGPSITALRTAGSSVFRIIQVDTYDLRVEGGAVTGENVLVVLADDMRADFLPYMVDLANRPARRFTRARVNTGLCGPYRWSQLTGQWQRDHGVDDNPSTLGPFDLENTLPGWVKAGPGSYRTGMFGKYLNADKVPVPPACFDVWRQLVNNPDGTYRMLGFGVWDGTDDLEPEGTMLDYLCDEVLAFAGASADPWFALLCPTSPHFPFSPLPEDLFVWSHVRGPEPPDLHPSKPSWFRALAPLGWQSRTSFRAAARAQARELTAFDRMLTRLLAQLEGMGQLASTVVMFTSDNGLNYGENRQPGVGAVKNDLTEASLRVPMVCLGPGFTSGDSPAQVSTDVDVNATVVAITGCTAGLPGQRGVDLRTLQGAPSPRPLLHERSGFMPFDWIQHHGKAVSTEDRKLMRWTDADPADALELYDLALDPLELVNVAGDPAYAGDVATLGAVLDGLLL